MKEQLVKKQKGLLGNGNTEIFTFTVQNAPDCDNDIYGGDLHIFWRKKEAGPLWDLVLWPLTFRRLPCWPRGPPARKRLRGRLCGQNAGRADPNGLVQLPEFCPNRAGAISVLLGEPVAAGQLGVFERLWVPPVSPFPVIGIRGQCRPRSGERVEKTEAQGLSSLSKGHIEDYRSNDARGPASVRMLRIISYLSKECGSSAELAFKSPVSTEKTQRCGGWSPLWVGRQREPAPFPARTCPT
ncbi:uncharacterized protein LOC129144684 [Talpa occidentalis]|uniref:uncharacterized protein LOC129144684 n=1 Tax=Talpa occidentalis TaxID=50954 RepID=UPI0023F6D51A|nr:uncharacterized protein LOC129144684 [Talpa occidentalis]